MSILKEKCMFSEVNGIVMSNGNPVEGAEVERYYKWQGPDKSKKEVVLTDAQGRFSFAATFDTTLLASIFPHNPSIQQEIHIRYGGKQYEAYMLMKNDYERNSELNGKPLSLICNLEDEPSREGGFYGICTLVDE